MYCVVNKNAAVGPLWNKYTKNIMTLDSVLDGYKSGEGYK